MPKKQAYVVRGTFEVDVEATVEAESEQEALEMVERELAEPMLLCGNGGSDKMVGMDDTDDISVSLSPGTIEWDSFTWDEEKEDRNAEV